MTWSLVYVPLLLAPLLTFDEFNSVGMGSFQETEFYLLFGCAVGSPIVVSRGNQGGLACCLIEGKGPQSFSATLSARSAPTGAKFRLDDKSSSGTWNL